MNNTIPNNTIRQLLILLIILLLGYVLFVHLKFFLPAFLGAYTLFVVMRKSMFALTGEYKWNRNLAAAVLMLSSFILILMPVLLLINLLSSRISFAIEHSTEVLEGLKGFINTYEKRLGI